MVAPSSSSVFNSHVTSGEKCVEIVKTLHVKFFPFGCREPSRNVTVNDGKIQASASNDSLRPVEYDAKRILVRR